MRKTTRKTKSIEYWRSCLTKVKCSIKANKLKNLVEQYTEVENYYNSSEFINERLQDEKWKQSATDVWSFERAIVCNTEFDPPDLNKNPFILKCCINKDLKFVYDIRYHYPKINTNCNNKNISDKLDELEFRIKQDYDNFIFESFKIRVLEIYAMTGYIHQLIEKEIDCFLSDVRLWLKEDTDNFQRYRNPINIRNTCRRYVLFEKNINLKFSLKNYMRRLRFGRPAVADDDLPF